jgi:hypothetical protein
MVLLVTTAVLSSNLPSVVPSCHAFQTPGTVAMKKPQQQSTIRSGSATTKCSTARLSLMMDAQDALTHLATVSTTTSMANSPPDLESVHILLLNSYQQILADAAVASASTNDGWWSSYLNIFKTALTLVHNTIDGPLKSVGVTQTWGPSIALFTAGTSVVIVRSWVQML